MINITILSVGSFKEKYLEAFKDEYLKRLQKFAKIKEVVLKDEALKDSVSDLKETEGKRILAAIDDQSYVILLDLAGEELKSEELASKIDYISTYKTSNITFVIGGSYGVSESVKKRADWLLSISKLTFPHQIAKCILIEQLYRSFTILNNITYHK